MALSRKHATPTRHNQPATSKTIVIFGSAEDTTHEQALLSSLANDVSIVRCSAQGELLNLCQTQRPLFVVVNSQTISENDLNTLTTFLNEQRLPSLFFFQPRTDTHQNVSSVHVIPDSKRFFDWFLVKTTGKLLIVRSAEVDWIEAWGDYVRLHCGEKIHVSRNKISDVEQRLDGKQFLRINRSAMVNIARIRELSPIFHGDYLVTMHDGTQLNLSRTYHKQLDELFGASL
jgi:two-component system LytT family response regulator